MSYNKSTHRFEVSFTFKDKSGADRTAHAIWDILSDTAENAGVEVKNMLENYCGGEIVKRIND